MAEVWHLRYGTETGEYPKKGNLCIEWLAKLLAAPNRSLTVADLRGDPEGKLAADGMLRGECETDREGVNIIKYRLEEIEDMTAATGGSEAMENEKADLLRQLQAARDNMQLDSPLRKAHHNAATQIRMFLRKLATTMPKLSGHLDEALKLDFPHLGYYPPAVTSPWT